MHQVILSLGANYEAEKNLPEAQCSLGQILFSPIYTDAIWTEPIASKRTDLYLNQLVKAQTNVLEFDGIRHHLRDWERPYVLDLLPQL